MEMGRRIADADAFHGIRLPSPAPPSALAVYVHDAAPTTIAARPKMI
jgi:hypothetical protein